MNFEILPGCSMNAPSLPLPTPPQKKNQLKIEQSPFILPLSPWKQKENACKVWRDVKEVQSKHDSNNKLHTSEGNTVTQTNQELPCIHCY